MSWFLSFLTALSFLSRLVPAREADSDDLAASVFWYPPAGLCLGLVLALPFTLGLGGGRPLVQGVLFVTFSLWLTRALHWDGWADIFDALGSARHGDGFRAALKDSRLGAFGVAALAGGILCSAVCAAECLRQDAWPALVWSVLLGRCLAAPLASSAPFGAWSGLGNLIKSGADARSVLAALLFALLGGLVCCGFVVTLAGAVTAWAGLMFFSSLSRREGGLNGDYLGAAIIWGELSALVSAALFI